MDIVFIKELCIETVIGIYDWERKIKQFVCIDLELAKLWEIISTPGILEKTHPFCQTNDIIRWDCESSIDTIVYYIVF